MKRVTLLPGPHVDLARRAIEAVRVGIEWEERSLSELALARQSFATTRAMLKGALGAAEGTLRRALDAFAVVRPFRSEELDALLVAQTAEDEEGLSMHKTDAPPDVRRRAYARVATEAFQRAAHGARRRVTVASGMAAFDEAARAAARDWPQLIVDEAPPGEIERRDAGELDVLLAPAAFGERLASALEARSGAAPECLAAPAGCVFGAAGAMAMLGAAAMLLEQLHEGIPADRIVRAVDRVIARGGGAEDVPAEIR